MVCAEQFQSEDISENVISDQAALRKQARERRSRFEEISIHPADESEFMAQGWDVKRRGKRSTRLKREKSHDKLLEDRVWALLWEMGYRNISGSRYKIPFERADSSIGKKEIDVFAYDDETVFVIECKSKETRGRRSLQKDIHESIYLQESIRRSVFRFFGIKPKPKIIWIYVTYNIIWSEPDIDRAQSGKIHIITENELQYFQAFIKHMGPAGKYQVLSEFLQGQKVEGLQHVKLPAIRGRVAGETYYSFVTTPRALLKIAYVNHQALDNPLGRPAYQRMVSSNRIREIGKFIEAGGFFPTNILVNFTQKPRFDLISNEENVDKNIKFGWITFPSIYRSAWIIDGQHRLYGFSNLEDEYLDRPIFVLAFQNMEKHKEADLFMTINHKQKSVPKSLLVSLLADLKMGSDDPRTALSAIASSVVRAINADKSSPFFRRFAQHGIPPEEGQNLTVSEVVNGINRSSVVGRVVKKDRFPGPLTAATDELTVNRARIVLNGYFDAVREANPERWEAGKAAYVSVNPGVRAHLALLAEMMRYLELKDGVDFALLPENRIVNYLKELAVPVFDFICNANDEEIKAAFSRKFGEGGVREYIYKLFELVNAQHKDFGSEEFRTYLHQKSDNRVKEENQTIIKLQEDISNYVIEVLKQVHGKHKMQSGEPAFWALGIDSRRAKDNAYKKQQEDPVERQMPREAYLDILDLRDIVKQPNNWPHFEPIFSIPMADERKGKKHYLQWLTKFNELRRIPAHKSVLRTYAEEDFEFLDWLRSEFYGRLDHVEDVL